MLLPMMHIADPSFYDTVQTLTDRCDAVLVEGVGGAVSEGFSDIQQRAAAESGGLEAQIDRTGTAPRSHWYRSDEEPEAFEASWKAAPLWRRALFSLAQRLTGALYRSKRFRRYLLGSDMTLDFEALSRFAGQKLSQTMLQERDTALASTCEQMIDGWNGKIIAVVWGAVHIPALAEFLVHEHGYRIESEEWLTAMAA